MNYNLNAIGTALKKNKQMTRNNVRLKFEFAYVCIVSTQNRVAERSTFCSIPLLFRLKLTRGKSE